MELTFPNTALQYYMVPNGSSCYHLNLLLLREYEKINTCISYVLFSITLQVLQKGMLVSN